MDKQLAIIFKIMGMLMMAFSFTFLIPVGISFIYSDGQFHYFISAFLITMVLGALLWFPFRKVDYELKTRHGFIIVALFWSVLSLICALPLALSKELDISFIHAFFEATSGFTTTGATVLNHLETLPKSILWYRTQLHFFGGMGIIILAVAIMPLLGMGGMALFKAEVPGPMKEEKLTPRIAQTARNLWFVYISLMLACIASYYIAGMDLFDAITHGFSTVATAGFANYDDSIGYFQSEVINWIAIFFMFMGGINFTLHFLVFREKSIKRYFQNFELRTFFFVSVSASIIVALTLHYFSVFNGWYDSIVNAFFTVIAMITTTGFLINPFSDWPTFLPLLLIFLSFMGACAGSTTGGMKMIRIILICKQAYSEVKHLIHPRAELPVRVDGKVIPLSILASVWAFIVLYGLSTAVLTLVMIGCGLSPLDAFSAVAGCLNITGPALGSIANNYSSISDTGLSVLSFTMLLGRLEIFTIFVLLTPSFWRS